MMWSASACAKGTSATTERGCVASHRYTSRRRVTERSATRPCACGYSTSSSRRHHDRSRSSSRCAIDRASAAPSRTPPARRARGYTQDRRARRRAQPAIGKEHRAQRLVERRVEPKRNHEADRRQARAASRAADRSHSSPTTASTIASTPGNRNRSDWPNGRAPAAVDDVALRSGADSSSRSPSRAGCRDRAARRAFARLSA